MKNQTVKCKKCGGESVSFQMLERTKSRHPFSVLLWYLSGLWLLALISGRKKKLQKWAICNTCGNTWNPDKKNIGRAFLVINVIFWGAAILLFLVSLVINLFR